MVPDDKTIRRILDSLAPRLPEDGLRFWPAAAAAGWQGQPTRAGFVVSELDGRVIASQRSLLEEIGKVLDFPDYHGRNWDALTAK
ncbi:barstar family protein [Streptosporangium subroseum]|uniref:barstar family protein n=1 Tax=Streptosporangium subroseum TaxID=106412 RepID=UPI00341C1EF4